MNTVLTLAELETYDPHARHHSPQRRFLCPLCGDEKPRDATHRSLSLHAPTGKWLCHRCGARGLLNADSNATFTQTSPFHPRKPAKPRREGEFDWLRVWETALPLRGSPGAAYLRWRGIPTSLACATGVRYAPRWYWRPAVLFPLHDQAGQVVAVSGRFLNHRCALKTLTGGTKSLGVFATPNVWSAPHIALTEGPLDALTLAHCSLPALVLMGTSWPTWLPASLSGKQVLLATDADQAGDEAAEQLMEALSALTLPVARLRPTNGKDWNEMLMRAGRKEVRQALRDGLAQREQEETR